MDELEDTILQLPFGIVLVDTSRFNIGMNKIKQEHQEDLLRGVIDSFEYIKDEILKDAEIIAINDIAREFLGSSPVANLKELYFKIETNPSKGALKDFLYSYISDRVSFSRMTRLRKHDATIVDVRVTTIRPKSTKTKNRLYLMFDDKSELSQIKRISKENEELYLDFFNNSPFPIIIEDWTDTLEFISQYKITNGINEFFLKNPKLVEECYERLEMVDVNKELLNLYEFQDKGSFENRERILKLSYESFKLTLIDILSGLSGGSVESVIYTKTGSRKDILLNWRKHPRFEDKVHYIIVSMVDKTEYFQNQQKIIRSEKQLKESLENLNSFIQIASHDLKEQIRKIGSFTSLLDQEFHEFLNEDQIGYLSQINIGVKSAHNILNGFIKLSQFSTDTSNHIPIKLHELISDILTYEFDDIIIHREISVHLDVLPEILGNPGQIHTLFYNLIDNSIKFSDPKKELIIQIKANIAKTKIRISFMDNGFGIHEADFEHVFNPFFTEQHNVRSNEGFGLTICRKVMSIHNGSIFVEGSSKEGTIFCLDFPNYYT